MKKKWLQQLSQIDDIYLEEANPFPRKKKWYQSKALVAGIACVLLLGAAILFVPYRTTAMVLYRIFAPEQYELLVRIDEIIDDTQKTQNLFGILMDAQTTETSHNLGFMQGGSISITEQSSSSSYKEITDNQLEGVIEADRIKRSDTCIFYLYDYILYAYSIEQEHSQLLDSYNLWNSELFDAFAQTENLQLYKYDFYLSEDCSTITVILNYYNNLRTSDSTLWVEIINLDVSDPSNITKISSIKTKGYYHSSRLVDGDLLLFTQTPKYKNNINYLDKKNYLPYTCTKDGDYYYIEADSIACPQTIDTLSYMVVQMIDAKTLEIKDGYAFLSYSDILYVSDNTIYTSYTYTKHTRAQTLDKYEDATMVSCLTYDKDGFGYKGQFSVDGYLENQYSMDERNGILRMVTTLNGFYYTPVEEDGKIKITDYTSFMNASLYCIDINTLSVVAEVDAFAPEDENVQSVRFDGDTAYVCTVFTPGLKDPVFAFDLTDINNITYVNTGTIDGYSSSLVNLYDDYLLGVGVGARVDQLKIEIYEETDTEVAVLCTYELSDVYFSTKYKSYYIDRANNLFGLGIQPVDSEADSYYLLLHFNNGTLTEVNKSTLLGDVSNMRAVYIGEHLYMLGKNGTLVVEKIELYE